MSALNKNPPTGWLIPLWRDEFGVRLRIAADNVIGGTPLNIKSQIMFRVQSLAFVRGPRSYARVD